MLNRRAFSLIELLIVLAIVSVLGAMLLPAVERSVEQSRRLACANALRQMHLGAICYSDDWNARLPHYANPDIDSTYGSNANQCAVNSTWGATGWQVFLNGGYIPAGLHACPSMDFEPRRGWFTWGIHYGYRFNSLMAAWGELKVVRSDITLPPSAVMQFLNSGIVRDGAWRKRILFADNWNYVGTIAGINARSAEWNALRWSHTDVGQSIALDGRLRIDPVQTPYWDTTWLAWPGSPARLEQNLIYRNSF